MTSTIKDIRLLSGCPSIQKRISHCSDLGEYMMEATRRQWLITCEVTRYFQHSATEQVVNLINSSLTLLEQWQLKREQRSVL